MVNTSCCSISSLRLHLVIFICTLLLLLSACQQKWRTTQIEAKLEPVDNQLASNPDIEAMIQPYRLQLAETMGAVIGHSNTDLIKAKPEGTLNNFVADLLYERSTHYYGSIDIAFANYGGLRIPSIPQGAITLSKAYELMPFDNQLVILKMNGHLLQQLLDLIADRGGWAVSKELRFGIQNDRAVQVTIAGEPIDFEKEYAIAINDYVANGGDQCDFLKAAERTNLNVLIRDAIIEFIKMKEAKGEAVGAVLDGRIFLMGE